MSEAAPILRSARFRREREADWRRLETIVARAESNGLHALSFEEARDLGELYRKAANALSVAREISLDKGLLDYLEALTARAFLAVHAPRESLRGVLGRFLATGVPQAMRRSGLALLLSFLAMALGVAAAWALFLQDQSWFNTFVPGGFRVGRNLSSSREDLLAILYDSEHDIGGLAAFAAYLFSHNTTISIFAFALGIAACVPSFLLIFQNGLILGAMFGLYDDRGAALDLLGWLSIHGVTELSAIIIAGAGGFRLGLAVLFPGRLTRRAALAVAGRDAVKLALVAALMLVAAALLEGFGRQLVTDTATRLVIGWGMGVLWLGWFLLGGRGGRAR